MQRKFKHIFTITLFSLCFFGANAYAQEGEELPEKQQPEVVEKDSTQAEDSTLEEPKGDLINSISITPKDQRLLLPEGELVIPKPGVKPVQPSTNEKVKEPDAKSPNLRFNLLYYLFYKVKVGSTSSSSN